MVRKGPSGAPTLRRATKHRRILKQQLRRAVSRRPRKKILPRQSAEVYRGNIEKLKQAMNIGHVVVDKNNLADVERRVKNMIHNDENIEDNLNMEVGDRVIWNPGTQTLIVAKSDGNHRFEIRFKPETIEEKKRNEEWAKEAIDKRGAKALGDWIARRGPYPTGKKSSCGEAVGNLLNQFGFRKLLPQSGRHGNKWDSILESRNMSPYFTKVKVNHPNEAPPGSIVVFNEGAGGARRGSKRWQFGHVEIKGSNGLFYHYTKSPVSGGSVHSNTLRGEKYNRYTGFTGYAYVYNGKKPPG